MSPLKDKSFDSLKPVIVEMLTQDPGFAAVDVLHSDGESALSSDNVAHLKVLVPRLRKVVRYLPTQVNNDIDDDDDDDDDDADADVHADDDDDDDDVPAYDDDDDDDDNVPADDDDDDDDDDGPADEA